jgi:hypothetical protein
LRLICNKVTSRPYNYFFRFSYFFVGEMDFPYNAKNCKI